MYFTEEACHIQQCKYNGQQREKDEGKGDSVFQLYPPTILILRRRCHPHNT